MHAWNHFLHWPQLRRWHFVIRLLLAHVSMRCCFKSLTVSHHVCRSYLKANKISKSEGRDKDRWVCISFLKVCWCCLPKIIKISQYLSKLRLAKVGVLFSETQHIWQKQYSWTSVSGQPFNLWSSLIRHIIQCQVVNAIHKCIDMVVVMRHILGRFTPRYSRSCLKPDTFIFKE